MPSTQTAKAKSGLDDRGGSFFAPPFVARATVTGLVAVAVSFGAAVWALIAGLDLLAAHYGNAVLVPMSALDGLVGVVCGAMSFKLMQAERSRYRRMTAQLNTIAEINHHIRNALDGIEMSAYVTHNRQLIEDIDTGVKRIQWVVQELLPETAVGREEDTSPARDEVR